MQSCIEIFAEYINFRVAIDNIKTIICPQETQISSKESKQDLMMETCLSHLSRVPSSPVLQQHERRNHLQRCSDKPLGCYLLAEIKNNDNKLTYMNWPNFKGK